MPRLFSRINRLLVALFIAVVTAAPAFGDFGPRPVMNAAEIEMALKRLNVVGTALYVAAHPDDENTAMLTWLRNTAGTRAAYISMTRGDGGQNLIGDEKGDLLGFIRTHELLAARRIDGAEQNFTRALDFGYSKNPEETLDFWGHDATLGDLVRAIRRIQPDIVINRFPATGEGGHGHHTASAQLGIEAFEAAADPARFPESARQFGTWKPRRVLWNYFTWTAPPDSIASTLVTVDVGAYEPVLGKSCSELAADSRSMHKSQGFGSPERRGSIPNYFKVVAGEPATTSLFDGVDLTWERIEDGRKAGELLARARDEYDFRNPAAGLTVLATARKEIVRLLAKSGGHPQKTLLAAKQAEIEEVIRACAGLWLEATSNSHTYSPGDSIKVTVTAVNRSAADLSAENIAVNIDGPAPTGERALPPNVSVSATLAGLVPEGLTWEATQPYWLRRPPGRGTHELSAEALLDSPDNTPPIVASVDLRVAGETIRYEIPVIYRWTDRVKGEVFRPVIIAPPVTVSLDETAYLFSGPGPKAVRVQVAGRQAGDVTARLDLPAGWTSVPPEARVSLTAGVPADVRFMVTAPANGPADATVTAVATLGGIEYRRSARTISYDHIPTHTLFLPAEARFVKLDLKRRGDRVGYIMGPGDDVPDMLREAGYRVDLLTDSDLDTADLNVYDAVVVGIRAFNSRDALKQRVRRLHGYAEDGGTVVVQYNTSDGTLQSGFMPYAFKLGRDRVTQENADVTFIDPAQPVLNEPNKIAAADFDGWVQERGLYFASEWDEHYSPVLASHDPGEPDRNGGLLVARHGKGLVIYTGYAFFRQLPAGVPGAIRLFVNLVSAR